jgi:hypothetical protein
VRLFRATKAGALDGIIVFLIGFIVGTIRVLLLIPRLEETTAVMWRHPSSSRRVGSFAAGAWIGSMLTLDRNNL